MKIVITGSIAFDYLMSFPGRFYEHLLVEQLDKLSVSFLVDEMLVQRGGVAPNIAYTNALLGGRPRIMASAGADFTDYKIWLDEKGIDTGGIVVFEDVFCASFFVTTDKEQNQFASFYTGAMAKAVELSFAEHGGNAELAMISPNDPSAMCAYVQECKQSQIPYIYDPSQQIIRLSGQDLREGINGCMLLAVNEYELGMIKEKTNMGRQEILENAGGLLLTLGKHGSCIDMQGQQYKIPAVIPREIVEPTGAGDAYRGGLLRGIQLGLSWEVAGRMGALAAAYVLEHEGPQGHAFGISEFVTRYRQNFDDSGTLDVLLIDEQTQVLTSS
jgi:adenosine kinase